VAVDSVADVDAIVPWLPAKSALWYAAVAEVTTAVAEVFVEVATTTVEAAVDAAVDATV